MKALLVDDENKARKLLKTLIAKLFPEYILFEAATLLEGVAIIKEKQPDIIFLDIEMPEHSGLEILEFFEESAIDFQIIFITAYHKYAVEAFKLNAIDYLLKPIDTEELNQAILKATSKKNDANVAKNIESLKKSFKKLTQKKLALDVPRGIIFIDYDDILYFEADGMYTTVYLNSGKKEIICKPLKHFVTQLENHNGFYKPHRSFLVNISRVKEFIKRDGGYLIMENNYKISISRDKKRQFFDIVGTLTK